MKKALVRRFFHACFNRITMPAAACLVRDLSSIRHAERDDHGP